MHWIRLTFLLRMTILGCLLPIACVANDMCSAEEDISFLVNRPANAVSPCTVKKGCFLTEAGYQRRNWSTGGNADVFPLTQIRLGLPKTSEIYAYLPIYVGNHAPPFAGNTTTAIGGKHKFWGNDQLIFSVDGYLLVPGGTANYSTQTLGERLNGIVSYSINTKWNLLFMLSFFHQSGQVIQDEASSVAAPYLYYTGVGPDLVLSYVFTPKMTMYAEVFGQSKVSPNLGNGFNADGGLVLSVRKNITVDIEFGTRINGQLGTLNNYVGFGGAIQL